MKRKERKGIKTKIKWTKPRQERNKTPLNLKSIKKKIRQEKLNRTKGEERICQDTKEGEGQGGKLNRHDARKRERKRGGKRK